VLASPPLQSLHNGGENLRVICKSWRVPFMLALSVGVGTTGSQGAPLGGGLHLEQPGERLQRVAERRCWWQQGRRHCRGQRYARQTGDYYERDPDQLPYGTSRWWEEMLRANRAGNPGGGGRN
jgi:hypothetical protein